MVANYTVTDEHGATDTATLTITLTGTNDAAHITTVAGGDYNVTEAGGVSNAIPGDPSASGQLAITDADDGQAAFQAPPTLNGTYGTFTFNAANGSWTYTLDNSRPATQALAAGAAVTDSLTVTSSDGADLETITVNVAGTNDAAVISGTSSGSVTEATSASPGTPTATGDLNSTDVDNPNDAWTIVSSPHASTGGYGTYTIDATGHWSYTVDNSNPAVNALNNGQTLTDTFSVTTVDGTQQIVSVTINGATDNVAPVANSDILWVSNSTTVTLPTGVLMANDADPDGLSETITGITVTSGSPRPGCINPTALSPSRPNLPAEIRRPHRRDADLYDLRWSGGTSTDTVTVNVLAVPWRLRQIDLTGVGPYRRPISRRGAGQTI